MQRGMNYQILQLVLAELSSLVTGARVDRICEGNSGELCLFLHRRGGKSILIMSADRSMPRLHLIGKKPCAGHVPQGFAQYLKSRVTGAAVLGVRVLNEDRIAEFRLEKAGSEYRLVLELTGSSANLILTDATDVILAVYHPVLFTKTSSRPLMPGLRYVAPVKRPHLIVSPEKTFNDLEGTSFIPDGAELPFNRAAEAYFERLLEQKRAEALRSSLATVISQALAKTERRIAALSGDLAFADRADEYRQAGDLILGNLKKLATGMELVNLKRFDGGMVSVKLDPQRSPSQNAESYFKKYKRAKAGREIIMTRLHQSREELSYLKSLLVNTGRAHSDDLARIRAELVAQGYFMERGKETDKGANKPTTSPYRKILYQGWEIFVGKNASGNDHITTKLARPDDFWLHAEGMPGSHVLVRNPGRADIPQEVFLRAASLAAFYSKGRNAKKVPVTYTRARFVKKPKGVRPGQVTLSERRTVMVVPEEI